MPRIRILLGLLPFLLLACGDDDSTGPSTRETGTSSILLSRGGTPLEGARVLHHSRSGELLGETTVDASGFASLEITEGDWITTRAFDATDNEVTLNTVVGAGVDETIAFYDTVVRKRALKDEAVEITGTPPDPWDDFRYNAACIYGSTTFGLPVTVTISDACASDSGLLHLEARTLFQGDREAFAYVVDRPFDPSGTTIVDLDGLWRTDWHTIQLDLPPADFERSRMSINASNVRDGNQYGGVGSGQWSQGPYPSSIELLVPNGFPDHLVIVSSFSGVEDEYVYIAVRVPYRTQTSTLGFTDEYPLMSISQLDFTNPDRPRLRWEVDRYQFDGDAVILELGWESDGLSYVWTLYLPPASTEFRFPEMDAEDVPPMPDQANGFWGGQGFKDDSLVDGFSDFRQAPRAQSLALEEHSEPGFYVETWNGIEGTDGPRKREPSAASN